MTDRIEQTRRQFGAWAGGMAANLVAGGWQAARGETETPKTERDWAIGCFNRPWGPWTYDTALDGMRDAGFDMTGLLGDHKDEPFTMPEATEAYLDKLRDRIAERGLSVDVGWLRTGHDGPLDEAKRSARSQIDHARRLGVKYMLTVGTDVPATYDHYYRVMADAAAYAADREMQIVLKPHGGCSASAEEMLRCIDRVNQAAFRIWYDAGNIVHYTGQDPVADVERVADLVVGFSAKDCAKKGGDVMLQFGAGQVNFKGVFQKLEKAGFKGPVLVECCAGKTPEEVVAGARANREFLERVIQGL